MTQIRRLMLAAVLGVVLVLSACGGSATPAASLTVYSDEAAAPLVGALAAAFEATDASTGIQVVTGTDPGAETAVVVSFATNGAEVATDSAVSGTAFAVNPLLIAVAFNNPLGIADLADLSDSDLSIGICSTDTVCGEATAAALAAAGVVPDAAQVADIGTLLTGVERGDLDAVPAFSSDVFAELGYVDGIAIPAGFDPTATYLISVTGGDDDGAADAFVAFVLSSDGAAVVESLGMALP